MTGVQRFVARPIRPPRLEVERVQARLAAKLYGVANRTPSIGHYEILERIGSGGQGDVYLVDDPRLQRRLAIKVLRCEVGRDGLAEARALAQVVHPNVVPVLDVGTLPAGPDEGSRAYIVMEYVAGHSLEVWCAGDVPWSDRLRVLVEAGRGLVAAHAAGIAHGDFKPTNVRVGEDGRPRVLDFGLARWLPATATLSGDTVSSAGGTPGYRAPECGTRRPDARSDQYSFCASAWRLLVELPSSATPRRRELARVKKILRRGLRARAEDRWPSVVDVLARLEGSAGWRPGWRSVAVAAALGAAGWYGLGRGPAATPDRDESLDRVRVEIGRLHSAYLRERGKQAWRQDDVSQARDDLERAVHLADASGDDRASANAALILVDLLGRRLAAFDEARRWESHARASIARLDDRDLEARLDLRWGVILGMAGEPQAGREILHALLGRLEASDPSSTPSVAAPEVHSELARLEARAGRTSEALAWAGRAVDGQAALVGTTHPDYADALFRLGVAQEQRDDLDGARDSFERALEIHARSGNEALTVGIHNSLAIVHERQGDFEAAERRYAHVLRFAAEGGHAELLVVTQANLGLLELARGDPDAALDHFAIARTAAEDIHPHSDSMFMSIHNGVGLAHERRGEHEQAVASLERALETALALGMSTAKIGEQRWDLGRARYSSAATGARERARAEIEQAHAELRTDPDGYSETLAKVDAWLEAHGQNQPPPAAAP